MNGRAKFPGCLIRRPVEVVIILRVVLLAGDSSWLILVCSHLFKISLDLQTDLVQLSDRDLVRTLSGVVESPTHAFGSAPVRARTVATIPPWSI
jgi:hypothetical protein